MNVGDVIGLGCLVIATPLVWYAFFRVWREATALPGNKVARFTVIVSLILAVIVSVFSLIFLNNDAEIPPLDRESTRVITRLVVFSAVIPAVYVIRLYRSRT